ncbi:putative snf2 family domain-containing protein [Rosellinia necatrix]|uniref:Putative snf2 family domain-containing protein n=1 Tax=Rosellinia necatrix TaxID=77044 RepID=A0A1W2TM16_ROSNE|nr:putative snf2 family domain-containing protein [Rosellinia necatrix]
MDDPWDWDIDRVVQELCTPNRPWHTSSTPLKLPPLDQLEKALRENEVDGEVLLTYDQGELCAELGVKILRHRSTFKQAVHDLQVQSSRYRAYRKRQASEFEEREERVGNKVQRADGIQGKSLPETSIPTPNANAPFPEPAPLLDDPSPCTSENTHKKRKIAPMLLTTEIDLNRNRNIATEADTIRFPLDTSREDIYEVPIDDISDTIYANAYLGSAPVTRFDIINFGDASDFRHPELPSEESKEINLVSTTRLIPGRMIQTHRLLKRRLLRWDNRRRTGFTKPDIVPGSSNPDHDKVLPLYGDSDDDMEYDSDTWREIEAEEKQKKAESPKHGPKGLTIEEINSTFDRVMEEMAFRWKMTKLPKHARKAHIVWREGRRFGLKGSISRAKQDLHQFEARITKWRGTIQRNEYRNVKELENSLSSFEPSVFDREHRSWLIGVLTSPNEPTRLSRPRQPREKPSEPRPVLSDGEEILTSDSDDGMRDFIVDDELDTRLVASDGYLSDNDEDHNQFSDTVTDLIENDNTSGVGAKPSVEETEAPKIKTNPHTPLKPTQPDIIDLTTPSDPTRHIIHYKGGRLSPSDTPSRVNESTAFSPLIMGIADLTAAEQKVAKELLLMDQTFINALFSFPHSFTPEHIWSHLILPAFEREWPKAPLNTHTKKDGLAAYTLIRLFEIYKDNTSYKISRYKNLDEKGTQRLRELYVPYSEEWPAFIEFFKRLSDRFEWSATERSKMNQNVLAISAHGTEDEDTSAADSHSDEMEGDISLDENSNENLVLSGGTKNARKKKKKKKKKKRKEVVRNREAAMVRELDQAGRAERESRRKLLRERLVTEGSMALGSQHGSIIVNESKGDDQGFIYINDEIARRIKEHQVTGVRFMWDQVVVAKKRQGCLLAHTMGLGKTMQVITLLVAINQAALSSDPTVSSQIPEELRESRTLILCPATLVNNWHDELLSWLPENNKLGELYKIDAVMSTEQRNLVVHTWDALGGIMIIGYNLFKAFVDAQGMREIFLKRPNIVVADEAHMMKNPKAKTHVAAANFRTFSRIALTGSPLANNVEEYYSMINWVAPNYLGDIREFRAQYANPINHGLHADSTASDRRRAFRMLRVLKSEVSPKVSRITIAVLKHDIPLKKEFVITVPLTPIQRRAYEMFIQYHSMADPSSSRVPNFAIHDLSLICASPSIFLAKLKEMKTGGNNSTDRPERVTLPQQLISDEMALLRSAERGAKDDFTLSWKVPILLEILDQCKKLGEYVLLFSHSMVTLDYLEGVLRMKKLSVVRLDGKTQMADRQAIVKRFNKGNIDIFLISTRAGALGLNIIGANRVVIFDAQFNPQNEQQAVGRAYRIGQTKPVFVYRFVCGGTCEQRLLHQAIWKMQLASRVVDKKHPIHKAQRFTGAWAMPEEAEQKDLDPMLGKDAVLDALLRNQKYREGIRAIEMMDTFEEEAVEDAELSAEDVALADKMILDNELRRSGQPLPAQLPTNPTIGSRIAMSDSYFVPDTQPPPAGLLGESHRLTQHTFTEPPSAGQHTLQRSFHIPLDSNQGFPPSSPVVTTSWTSGVPIYQPSLATDARYHPPVLSNDVPDIRPPSSLPPMQLPGAEVHIRPSDSHPHRTSDATGSWNSLPAIQKDLHRAFVVKAGFPDERTRRQSSVIISSAIWDNLQHKTPKQQSTTEWAVMHAVSTTERFVEALCIGHISPLQLSQMTPGSIDQEAKTLKGMDASEWQAKKESWSSRTRSTDPEHLQSALQRLSTAPDRKASSQQLDQSKSYRLDDHQALRAVFERRRLKTQHENDQEALRAVAERRKAKDSSSQSSDTSNTSKEPRLPDWARDVVRQARIPPPSASAPSRTPPSPTSSRRPQPRTPFK